ncbi:helix-turn-helix domain-containing protein [Sphingobacterium faecium]|uniref:helix-turn-helix domain-containing protein n=1 Tax=Sphingobacterium faecium TaxID=34087 RepID=UPI0024DF6F28|nr:helix-turn-helix transcriptional regulator [Sphingobacterium faecium]
MIISYLNILTFRGFVLNEIKHSHNNSEKRKLEKEIDKLLGTRGLVLGKTFYDVIKLLNLNIDTVCFTLFPKESSSKLNLFPESNNKIHNFISTYIGDLKLLSKTTGIEYNRLTKLFNGEYKNAYPEDINGLAIAFSLKPSQLFEYFYGDGERPVIELPKPADGDVSEG